MIFFKRCTVAEYLAYNSVGPHFDGGGRKSDGCHSLRRASSRASEIQCAVTWSWRGDSLFQVERPRSMPSHSHKGDDTDRVLLLFWQPESYNLQTQRKPHQNRTILMSRNVTCHVTTSRRACDWTPACCTWFTFVSHNHLCRNENKVNESH